jgi:hypothetical protein
VFYYEACLAFGVNRTTQAVVLFENADVQTSCCTSERRNEPGEPCANHRDAWIAARALFHHGLFRSAGRMPRRRRYTQIACSLRRS